MNLNFFFCLFIIHLFSRFQWVWALSSQTKECLLFALLLFSSAGLFDEYNTLSPSKCICTRCSGTCYTWVGWMGWDGMGWDGMDGWMDASVLIQHTISPSNRVCLDSITAPQFTNNWLS